VVDDGRHLDDLKEARGEFSFSVTNSGEGKRGREE
jgi:hypothetical protein